MLVCCSVVNDIRVIRLKHVKDLPAVPHRANDDLQIQLRMIMAQLLLDRIGAVFINIKDNKLFWLVPCDLTAKLASDRAAPACDKDHLSFQMLKYLRPYLP